MNLLKEKAKRCIKERDFPAAKRVILVMLERGNQEPTTYSTLGDVCVELNEYDEALRHYQKKVVMHANDALTFCKIGQLYHQHLDDTEKAIEAFEQSIAIKPTSAAYFYYAKLAIDLNRSEFAEHLLSKCDDRACVNYLRGVLLMQKSDSNRDVALKYFERATQLMPHKYSYHYSYARHLDEGGYVPAANKAYDAALQAMHAATCKDYSLYYDYAVFRSDRFKDYIVALAYLQCASEVEGCNKQHQVELKRKQIEQLMRTPMGPIDIKSKMMIYSFEECITYWKVPPNLSLHQIRRLSQRRVEEAIFGGVDRLDRLHVHFSRVLAAQCQPKLAVVSSCMAAPMIIELLERVKLLPYFGADNVVGTGMRMRYESEIVGAHSAQCVTVATQSKYTLKGLTMDDMKRVECLLDVYEHDQFDIEVPSTTTTTTIDNTELDADQGRESTLAYLAKVLSVIEKYEKVRMRENYWVMLNLLSKAIEFIQNDSIMRWYAVCLAAIGHWQEAEAIFEKLFTTKHFDGSVEYALFLLSIERFKDAKDLFDLLLNKYSIEYLNDWMGSIGCAYAQCLEACTPNAADKCEEYYRAALDARYKYKADGYRHYYYGLFLFRKERWTESKQQFQHALRCDHSSSVFHYALSQVLFGTNECEAAKKHWKQTVISQYHIGELKDNFYHHHRSGYAKMNTFGKLTDVEGADIQENLSVKSQDSQPEDLSADCKDPGGDYHVFAQRFDSFWFDGVNQMDPEFNSYYDQFLAKEMNDIRIILNGKNLEELLRCEIGIKKQRHIQLIIKKANALKQEEQQKK